MKNLTNNPYGKYNGNEIKYILEALDSENKPKVPFNQKFEEAFSKKFGNRYSIACNSGTSGLHAACYAVGVSQGDEVIGPALTVVMDSWAIMHLGATPVFADVNPDTLTIDPDDIERKITSRTKAIIVVSMHGLSVDIDPIMDIAKRNNLLVIEDSAQTVLGKYKGRMAGTLADIGVFSFEEKKHMTTGSEGGMIVTNNESLAIRARKFAGLGYKHMSAEAGRTSLALSTAQDPSYERFDTVGLNYRMNEISAAVGLGQLERIDQIVDRRKKCGSYFLDAIKGADYLVPQKTPNCCDNSFYDFTVKYSGEEKTGLTWKEFYNQYKEMGGDGFYGACVIPYLEPAFWGLSINGNHYKKGLCPVAESIQPQVMQFKTNYRDLSIAEEKAKILKQLIKKLS